MILQNILRQNIYLWLTDLDPDGKSRRLLARIFLALILGLGIFFALGLESKFVIWLIICAVNGLMALASAPKDYLFRYFSLAFFANFSAILCAYFVHNESPYFIFMVAFVGFCAGITSGFGQSGKLIGALSFVLFSVMSFVDVAPDNLQYVLISFLIAFFCVFIVMFLAVPIPKETILRANKKRVYRLFVELLSNDTAFNVSTVGLILQGIRSSVCERLPKECDEIIGRYVTLKNMILTLSRYDDNIHLNILCFYEVYRKISVYKNALINLFDTMSQDKDTTIAYKKFVAINNELSQSIQTIILNNKALDNKAVAHIASAFYITNEIVNIMSLELGYNV